VWSPLPVARDFATLLAELATMPQRVADKLAAIPAERRSERPVAVHATAFRL
jgi:hypothetical protein